MQPTGGCGHLDVIDLSFLPSHQRSTQGWSQGDGGQLKCAANMNGQWGERGENKNQESQAATCTDIVESNAFFQSKVNTGVKVQTRDCLLCSRYPTHTQSHHSLHCRLSPWQVKLV